MDELTWGALTVTLTLLGGLWTWFAFRRRGPAAGLRGAGLTLLPAAAWLTGTLQMFTEIAGSVADWATHLVFSPVVWTGVVLAGLAVVLLGLSATLRRLGSGGPERRPERRSVRAPGTESHAGPRTGRRATPDDDDMADVEAILRKRGIS